MTIAAALAAVMTVFGVGSVANADPDGFIDIPDDELRHCVNNQIPGNTFDADITATQAATVHEIHCGSRDVELLDGIEHLTSVTSMDLGGNHISDLGPLATVTSLEYLNLWSNQIDDVAPLAALDGLEELRLQANQITDVGPLDALTSLEILDINDNQISDVAPLAALTNLDALDINFNRIVDVSPLSAVADTATTFLAWNQSIDLGEVLRGQALPNPVVGLDGTPVSLSDLYDAGDHTFTAEDLGSGSVSWLEDDDSFSGTLSFEAVLGEVVSIEVTPSAFEVDEGGSIDLTVTGQDAVGNTVPIDERDVEVTSEVASDEIDGLTVTFPTASPHELTVTYWPTELRETVTITVNAATVDTAEGSSPDEAGLRSAGAGLPATGAGFSMPILGLAVLMVVVGAGLVSVSRRKTVR